MSERSTKLLLVLLASGLWVAALRTLPTTPPARAQTQAAHPSKSDEELRRLCAEDQADRTPPQGKAIDWAVVAPRDRARLGRVRELYTQDRLRTADDYDCAATVLLHGDAPEDFLLAHELWVVAIARGKNDPDTLAAAAAAEDRFLTKISRPQRFGTQVHSVDGGPVELYPVDAGVSDGLRRAMIGHTLAEIKARVAEMNRK